MASAHAVDPRVSDILRPTSVNCNGLPLATPVSTRCNTCSTFCRMVRSSFRISITTLLAADVRSLTLPTQMPTLTSATIQGSGLDRTPLTNSDIVYHLSLSRRCTGGLPALAPHRDRRAPTPAPGRPTDARLARGTAFIRSTVFPRKVYVGRILSSPIARLRATPTVERTLLAHQVLGAQSWGMDAAIRYGVGRHAGHRTLTPYAGLTASDLRPQCRTLAKSTTKPSASARPDPHRTSSSGLDCPGAHDKHAAANVRGEWNRDTSCAGGGRHRSRAKHEAATRTCARGQVLETMNTTGTPVAASKPRSGLLPTATQTVSIASRRNAATPGARGSDDA